MDKSPPSPPRNKWYSSNYRSLRQMFCCTLLWTSFYFLHQIYLLGTIPYTLFHSYSASIHIFICWIFNLPWNYIGNTGCPQALDIYTVARDGYQAGNRTGYWQFNPTLPTLLCQFHQKRFHDLQNWLGRFPFNPLDLTQTLPPAWNLMLVSSIRK